MRLFLGIACRNIVAARKEAGPEGTLRSKCFSRLEITPAMELRSESTHAALYCEEVHAENNAFSGRGGCGVKGVAGFSEA